MPRRASETSLRSFVFAHREGIEAALVEGDSMRKIARALGHEARFHSFRTYYYQAREAHLMRSQRRVKPRRLELAEAPAMT